MSLKVDFLKESINFNQRVIEMVDKKAYLHLVLLIGIIIASTLAMVSGFNDGFILVKILTLFYIVTIGYTAFSILKLIEDVIYPRVKIAKDSESLFFMSPDGFANIKVIEEKLDDKNIERDLVINMVNLAHIRAIKIKGLQNILPHIKIVLILLFSTLLLSSLNYAF